MKIIAPFISCLINSGFETDEVNELNNALAQGYSQIYIQTPKGLFKHHVLRPGKDGLQRHVRVPVTEIPGVKIKEIKPEIRFLPDGRIPIRLLDQVKAFFKEVIRAKGTAVEAMIWILWNQERGYYLHVPNQVVSKASARYDWTNFPAESSIIVDIHSHADFSAFFSGTDNADDSNAIRFSGVIGNNDTDRPTSKWRFNFFNQKFDLEIEDIFTYSSEVVETPKEWLESVQTPTYSGKNKSQPSYYYPSHLSGMSRHQGRLHLSDDDDDGSKFTQEKKEKLRSGQQKQKSVPDSRDSRRGRSSANDTNSLSMPKRVSVGGQMFLDTGNELLPIAEVRERSLQREEQKVLSSFSNPIERGLELLKDLPEIPSYKEIKVEFIDEDRAGIFEGSEDRLHQLAMRQAQEDLLSESAEEHLDALESQRLVRGHTDLSVENLSPLDIPLEFDAIAIDHGIDAAKAYAVIDRASEDLIGKGDVLVRAVENLFQLVEDEDKLSAFRKLAELLPRESLEKLAHNGL